MSEFEFTNCEKGTMGSKAILLVAAFVSSCILITELIFRKNSLELELIVWAIILTVSGLMLNDRRKKFDVIIDQEGVLIRDSKSQNQIQRLQKGEFQIDISAINIAPPEDDGLDFSEPILVYELILRMGNSIISLKRFDDIDFQQGREDVESMRNAIIELIN
jgi:hypothetical protein|tara:strand:- start:123 stop:608 length:486 start_codon:yes stop_codon:yes gene_type:complete